MVPSEVQYCSDSFEIAIGQGRGIVAGQRSEVSLSRSEIRDYYLSQDEANITKSLDTSQGLPRFNVVSQELEPGIVDSTVLPKHTVESMFSSDLDAFQTSWCLESSINDGVIHNFIQGLYATTYISGRFALPKERVVEILGVGVSNAMRHFTKREWETAVSYSLEILQYKDALCSFLVIISSSFQPFFPSMTLSLHLDYVSALLR